MQLAASHSSKNILDFVNGQKIHEYSQKGTVTPDHVIRTKPVPLILNANKAGNKVNFKKIFENQLDKYIKDYNKYFEQNNKRANFSKIKFFRKENRI